jgi:hypothetical protein
MSIWADVKSQESSHTALAEIQSARSRTTWLLNVRNQTMKNMPNADVQTDMSVCAKRKLQFRALHSFFWISLTVSS